MSTADSFAVWKFQHQVDFSTVAHALITDFRIRGQWLMVNPDTLKIVGNLISGQYLFSASVSKPAFQVECVKTESGVLGPAAFLSIMRRKVQIGYRIRVPAVCFKIKIRRRCCG